MLRLVGKSLLRRSDEGRFTLHPVVQQFAAKELPAARRTALLQAHAEYFLKRLANERGVGLGALMHRALTLAMRLRHMPLMLTTIGQAARLHAVRGSHAALGWLAFVLGHASLRVDIRSELKPIFERLVPAAAQRTALLAGRAHASVTTICGEMLAAYHDTREPQSASVAP